jgi:hypothetical protein
VLREDTPGQDRYARRRDCSRVCHRVTWPNAGDSTVVTYRVAAVSQNMSARSQAAPTWVNVAPGAGCGPVTTTIRGLRRGDRYVFWLDAVVKDAASATAETTIAESVGLQIP